MALMLTIDLYVVPRLRMSGAVLLLPPHAFMAWKETTLPFTTFILRV